MQHSEHLFKMKSTNKMQLSRQFMYPTKEYTRRRAVQIKELMAISSVWWTGLVNNVRVRKKNKNRSVPDRIHIMRDEHIENKKRDYFLKQIFVRPARNAPIALPREDTARARKTFGIVLARAPTSKHPKNICRLLHSQLANPGNNKCAQ